MKMINESWDVLGILIVFMMLSAYYRPFIGLLTQINKPGLFSKIIFISVLLNLALNYILIPRIGIYGAAVSTGVIFLVESLALFISAQKTIDFENINRSKIS